MRQKQAELSIEQKLELIRFALEKGANIDIHFHGLSKTDGESLAVDFCGMTNTTFEKKFGGTTQWFKIYPGNDLEVSIFYKYSIEEEKAKLLAELAELEQGEQVNA
jgi:hypothetical protein